MSVSARCLQVLIKSFSKDPFNASKLEAVKAIAARIIAQGM